MSRTRNPRDGAKAPLRTSILGAAAIMLAAGCGDATGSEPELPPGDTYEVVEPLRTFSVSDVDYSMVATDEGDIYMRAEASSGVSHLPHAELVAEHGGLTSLELYLALTPSDEPPAQALLDAHEREATAYGRENSDVRHVEYDASPVLVPKDFSTDCAYMRRLSPANIRGLAPRPG